MERRRRLQNQMRKRAMEERLRTTKRLRRRAKFRRPSGWSNSETSSDTPISPSSSSRSRSRSRRKRRKKRRKSSRKKKRKRSRSREGSSKKKKKKELTAEQLKILDQACAKADQAKKARQIEKKTEEEHKQEEQEKEKELLAKLKSEREEKEAKEKKKLEAFAEWEKKHAAAQARFAEKQLKGLELILDRKAHPEKHKRKRKSKAKPRKQVPFQQKGKGTYWIVHRPNADFEIGKVIKETERAKDQQGTTWICFFSQQKRHDMWARADILQRLDFNPNSSSPKQLAITAHGEVPVAPAGPLAITDGKEADPAALAPPEIFGTAAKTEVDVKTEPDVKTEKDKGT